MNEISMNDMLARMRALAAAAGQHVPAATPPVAPAAKGPDFGGLVRNALNSVNETQQHAEKLATAFDLGDPKVGLADVMIATQKANLSFQAVTQVRNKLVQAYQEIMNMPV
jgi:flagellar hook-basal body complex protein FliE